MLIEEFAPQPPIKATEVRASIESVESLVTPPVQVFKRKENVSDSLLSQLFMTYEVDGVHLLDSPYPSSGRLSEVHDVE